MKKIDLIKKTFESTTIAVSHYTCLQNVIEILEMSKKIYNFAIILFLLINNYVTQTNSADK